MSALTIVITDAGRAEHLNAQNTGAGPLEITEVQLGAGQYAVGEANKTQTELAEPIKSLATFAGMAVADDTLHVSIKDETDDAYRVGEFGLFTASGTLYAVYSQPADQGWIIEKAAPSSLLLAVDIILDTLNATALSFGELEFVNPPASETVPGVLKVASEESITAGTDHRSAVTPKGLQQKVNAYFPPGTRMLFQQSSAPLGWVKETDQTANDRALRVVTGEAGQGGTAGFQTAFNNAVVTSESGAQSLDVTVSGRTLTIAQLPDLYSRLGAFWFYNTGSVQGRFSMDGLVTTAYIGGGSTLSVAKGVFFRAGDDEPHDHAASVDPIEDHTHTTNFNVAYTDVIVAVKQ